MNDLFCNLLLGEIFMKVKLLLKEQAKETARYCFQMDTQKPRQDSEPGLVRWRGPLSSGFTCGPAASASGDCFLRCAVLCIIDTTRQMKMETIKSGHFQDPGNFHLVCSMFGNFLRPTFNVINKNT